jgi:hypothetical protein
VTEDMPTTPLRGLTNRLAERISAPVWMVDTACIVPSRIYGRAFNRAFKFRSAMKPLLEGRIRSPWQDTPPPSKYAGSLPFVPVNFEDTTIPKLIAACDIDHSIGPVPHTPGGSSAGYRRWAHFRRTSLSKYARRRNNPLTPAGVSRMSAYLHFGHVSPFRIAREVYGMRGQGAEKYLDELLTWRELAYNWCHFRTEHESLNALPEWARATWDRHRKDTRHVLSWETLARGKTGDPLWDACQQSLLVHGELHNNVRMTWGKAIARWTGSPEETLRTLVDLNHRYALDGRDPASYGGLLWCMGLFDREFPPERPISGLVRPRETEQHAERLDVEAFSAHTSRSLYTVPPRVAVIGAGPAGSLLARTLSDHGIDVQVFDKGRGPGGRTASRTGTKGTEVSSFDFGAQYLSFRSRHLRHRVKSWCDDGVIAPWEARFAQIKGGVVTPIAPAHVRYVATPTMRSLVTYLLGDVQVHQNTQITRIKSNGPQWMLETDQRTFGSFDAVLVATPAPQANNLFGPISEVLAGFANRASYAPCWAISAYGGADDLAFDGALVSDSPISWIARDDSKPNRPTGIRWVLHANPTWSKTHLEADKDRVVDMLTEAAKNLGLGTFSKAYAHRWRYALVTANAGATCRYLPSQGLGATGDWCIGPRVESALTSSMHLAGEVLTAFGERLGHRPTTEQAPITTTDTRQRSLL